jgi:hypothetical protein
MLRPPVGSSGTRGVALRGGLRSLSRRVNCYYRPIFQPPRSRVSLACGNRLRVVSHPLVGAGRVFRRRAVAWRLPSRLAALFTRSLSSLARRKYGTHLDGLSARVPVLRLRPARGCCRRVRKLPKAGSRFYRPNAQRAYNALELVQGLQSARQTENRVREVGVSAIAAQSSLGRGSLVVLPLQIPRSFHASASPGASSSAFRNSRIAPFRSPLFYIG